jgi:hypothetical protein
MLNIREVIRRLLKYAVLVVIVGFSAHSIPKQPPKTMEVVWIALIAGMVFSILDSVTPSIKIHVEKKTE